MRAAWAISIIIPLQQQRKEVTEHICHFNWIKLCRLMARTTNTNPSMKLPFSLSFVCQGLSLCVYVRVCVVLAGGGV